MSGRIFCLRRLEVQLSQDFDGAKKSPTAEKKKPCTCIKAYIMIERSPHEPTVQCLTPSAMPMAQENCFGGLLTNI